MSEIRIVTISRQVGSGGHSLGLALSEKLGWEFYDKDLIREVAAKAGYDENFVQAMDNAEVPVRGLAKFLVGRDNRGKSIQDYLYDAECTVINELAEKGPFVVVGRGADVILENRADVLKVFVYADFEYRCNRFLELYGEPEIPIKKFIHEKDKRRAARYKYHTKMEWLDPHSYDMMLNTGALGQEECLKIMLHAVELYEGT